MTVPASSARPRPASRSEGRGPLLVCGSPVGIRTAGGESIPRICPRSRAIGWMKWRYATIARFHSRLPLSEATSDRIAYVRFLVTVTARPMRPVPSRSAAAQSCVRSAATMMPASVRTNENTCHRIEWGRNANGCTSARYTDGNAAVPQTPALMRVPQSDRTNGSGL